MSSKSPKAKGSLKIAKPSKPSPKKVQFSKKRKYNQDSESEDSSIGEELDLNDDADEQLTKPAEPVEKITIKKQKIVEKPQDESTDEEDEAADDGDDDDSSDEDEEYDSDADENLPQLKKNKGNKHDDGSKLFSSAMNALLDTKLKAYDRKDPILARSKGQLKKLESEKLELKAKRLILAEKKARLTSNRNSNLLPSADDANAREILEKEKRFKKVAQRGVIKLFNVVLSTQTQTSQELDKAKVLGGTKKKELMTEISKEKFLDLVQQAGNK